MVTNPGRVFFDGDGGLPAIGKGENLGEVGLKLLFG